MASAFQKRPELRPVICSALRRVCVQCRLALRAAGEEVGHADPSYTRDDEPAPPGASEEEAVHVDVPATATPEAARATLAALRGDARTWLPLLLTAFVAAPPNARGQLEGAAAAYACVCDAPTLALLFRSAVAKLMKAVEQSRAEELGPGALTEGGDTDAERRCTFTEAALCLAGGLDAAGAGVLYRAALPGIEDPHPAVQKKGYKALAYLCESRPDFLAPNFQGVAAALLGASPASVSAAKRYRLRCLKAVVLELVRPDGADVDLRALPGVGGEAMSEDEEEEGGGGGGGGGRGARARAVLAPLVSEIVLSLKEANKRTRAAAYDLLVEVAAAAHEAEPPPPPRLQLGGGGGGEFEVDPGAAPGGLHSLFSMVLGGLVGATPHMVSASLMAMARLLFEFAPSLAGLVPELMPAALSLLRSKAREVIKSVLGFLKVSAPSRARR
jgi:ribosomal RNA-processing protein 12